MEAHRPGGGGRDRAMGPRTGPGGLAGRDEGARAAGGAGGILRAQAVEVDVPVLGALDRKAPAADAADEQPLQVVAVLDVADGAAGPSGEQVLDLEEVLRVHQRLV